MTKQNRIVTVMFSEVRVGELQSAKLYYISHICDIFFCDPP